MPEHCRNWKGDERCGSLAEFIVWGKLLPPKALGPRCYDCAAEQIGHAALVPGNPQGYAVLHLQALRAEYEGEIKYWRERAELAQAGREEEMTKLDEEKAGRSLLAKATDELREYEGEIERLKGERNTASRHKRELHERANRAEVARDEAEAEVERLRELVASLEAEVHRPLREEAAEEEGR